MYCISFTPDTLVSNSLLQWKFLFVIFYTIVFFFLISCIYLTGTSRIDLRDDMFPMESDESGWFCQDCNHYCPLRASHCKHCKRCVLRKDHHCSFMGICVGMENHLFFYLFLIFLLIFDTFNIIIFKNSLKDDQPFDEWIKYSLLPNFAFYGSIISIIQPVMLVPVHTFLIITNATTWEMLKGKSITYLTNWKGRLSPFSRGIRHNIREFIFMRWEVPVYKVPFTPEEMEQYKSENSCIYNDSCNCF